MVNTRTKQRSFRRRKSSILSKSAKRAPIRRRPSLTRAGGRISQSSESVLDIARETLKRNAARKTKPRKRRPSQLPRVAGLMQERIEEQRRLSVELSKEILEKVREYDQRKSSKQKAGTRRRKPRFTKRIGAAAPKRTGGKGKRSPRRSSALSKREKNVKQLMKANQKLQKQLSSEKSWRSLTKKKRLTSAARKRRETFAQVATALDLPLMTLHSLGLFDKLHGDSTSVETPEEYATQDYSPNETTATREYSPNATAEQKV